MSVWRLWSVSVWRSHALDPPLWKIPDQALSLCLSLARAHSLSMDDAASFFSVERVWWGRWVEGGGRKRYSKQKAMYEMDAARDRRRRLSVPVVWYHANRGKRDLL